MGALANIVSRIAGRFGLVDPSTSGRVSDSDLPYDVVSLFYWRGPGNSVNFGDYLSLVLVTKLLADHGYTLGDEVSKARRILAVGSILHLARTGDLIWGTGRNGRVPDSGHKFAALDVRSVRGPLTAEFLHKRGLIVPEVYGDPALLLPTLFPGRFVRQSDISVGVVPNFADLAQFHGAAHVISPLLPWNRCVQEIVNCDFVVATSLHGLVISDAYGVPCRYLRISDHEPLFKYQDYFEGSGRTNFKFATSLEEAINMGPMESPRWAAQPLLDAFPIDLWTAPRDSQ